MYKTLKIKYFKKKLYFLINLTVKKNQIIKKIFLGKYSHIKNIDNRLIFIENLNSYVGKKSELNI